MIVESIGSSAATLASDLRTDHAGETGAVTIYSGILATSRNADVRRLAQGQPVTETGHPAAIELLLSWRADEVGHRDEAAMMLARSAGPSSLALRPWVWSVGAGSRVAVKICRRV